MQAAKQLLDCHGPEIIEQAYLLSLKNRRTKLKQTASKLGSKTEEWRELWDEIDCLDSVIIAIESMQPV